MMGVTNEGNFIFEIKPTNDNLIFSGNEVYLFYVGIHWGFIHHSTFFGLQTMKVIEE